MDKAEANCRRFKMGAKKWSPALKKARTAFEYWQGRLTHAKGLRSNVKRLRILQRDLKLSYDPTLTRDDLVVKVKEAFVERR